MGTQPLLETERLLLRPLSLEDASRIQDLASDKLVSEMTANIPHPYPDDAASEWISGHQQKWSDREQANFAITLKPTNKIVGCISLEFKNANEAELSYWVGVEFWGVGYATEAVKKMISYGFSELTLHCIKARVLSRNPASGKVLLKSGLQFLETIEGNCGDKFESLDYFSIEPKT